MVSSRTQIHFNGLDELGEMAKAMKTMQDLLWSVFQQLTTSAQELAASSQQFASTSQSAAANMQEISASVGINI